MKIKSILSILLLVLLSACLTNNPGCPEVPDEFHFLQGAPESYPAPTAQTSPVEVEIGRRTMTVDRLISGPLCNDTWSGIVYVSCDVQVYQWDNQPTFLKDCDLQVEPGTVVYVAYHNDAAYYKGCYACHTTGEGLDP